MEHIFHDSEVSLGKQKEARRFELQMNHAQLKKLETESQNADVLPQCGTVSKAGKCLC